MVGPEFMETEIRGGRDATGEAEEKKGRERVDLKELQGQGILLGRGGVAQSRNVTRKMSPPRGFLELPGICPRAASSSWGRIFVSKSHFVAAALCESVNPSTGLRFSTPQLS